MDIQIKLELSEINSILRILAKEPYEFSEPFITKIKKQATEQLAEANKPKTPDPAAEQSPTDAPA